MRVAMLAAFLLAICSSAVAGPPHDLWGYFPGQTLEQAQNVDPSRAAQACDFKGVWKCISWDRYYLGQSAEIVIQLGDDKKVKQIVFNILKVKPEDGYDCRQVATIALGEAVKAYGNYSKQTRDREFVWDDGSFRYDVTVLCISMSSGQTAGGVVGALTRDQ